MPHTRLPLLLCRSSGLDTDAIFSITSGRAQPRGGSAAAAEISSLHPAFSWAAPRRQQQPAPASQGRSSSATADLDDLMTPLPGSPRGARVSAAEVVMTAAPGVE